jgi:hypothetical protein
VGQPQLVGILGLGVLRRAAAVHVHVDEAGHQVHAGRVELVVGLLRGTIRPERQPGRSGAPNRSNAIVLDDDVDRAARRAARAVDENDAADRNV